MSETSLSGLCSFWRSSGIIQSVFSSVWGLLPLLLLRLYHCHQHLSGPLLCSSDYVLAPKACFSRPAQKFHTPQALSYSYLQSLCIYDINFQVEKHTTEEIPHYVYMWVSSCLSNMALKKSLFLFPLSCHVQLSKISWL